MIREKIGSGSPTVLNADDFTPRTKRILQVAAMAGARLHTSYVGTEHLLIAILEDGQSYAMRFLQLLGVDPNRIISELSSVLNNTSFSGGNDYKHPQKQGHYEFQMLRYRHRLHLHPLLGRSGNGRHRHRPQEPAR